MSFPLPRWVFTFLLLCTSDLILFGILIWKPWESKESRTERKRGDQFRTDAQNASKRTIRHNLLRSLFTDAAASTWLTVILYSVAIWICSVAKQRGKWTALAFCLLAIGIMSVTFVLEGVEIAYTELRDKDKTQFSGRVAKVFNRIKGLRGSFYEAREWLMVALVVAATWMLETDVYILPGITTYEEKSTEGHIIRLLISLALTTFPFVWFAQGPGKFIARKNSVQFLKYRSTRVFVEVIAIAAFLLDLTGFEYPSEVAENVALKIWRKSRRRRGLLQSEFSFFADSVRKYGAGFLISDDYILVRRDGHCEISSRSLSYIEIPRSGIARRFDFEEGFVLGTKDVLAGDKSPNTQWWAFDAPLLGERVTRRNLRTWASLFYSESPERWTCKGYEHIDAENFKIVPKIEDLPNTTPLGSDPSDSSEARALQRLLVSLEFRQKMPCKPPKGKRRGMLVLWQIKCQTNPRTIPLPTAWDDPPKHYSYSKRHPMPCLRSTIVIDLADEPETEPGVIFVKPEKQKSFEVSFNRIKHTRETERFRKQKRTLLLPGAPERPESQKPNNLGKRMVCYVDSLLPAAFYTINLYMEKRRPTEYQLPTFTHGEVLPALAAAADPLDAPTASPLDARTASPLDAPAASPLDAPAASPLDAPAADPLDAPTASPLDAPTASPLADAARTHIMGGKDGKVSITKTY